MGASKVEWVQDECSECGKLFTQHRAYSRRLTCGDKCMIARQSRLANERHTLVDTTKSKE